MVAVVAPVGGSVAASTYAGTNETVWQTTGGGLIRDFATDGNRVYLGGSFTGMRADAAAPTVDQGRLAAVHAGTGALVPGFAPTLNGEVRALEMAADGSRLYAAGTFTTVNGVARRGLVALDPVTGATIPGFATTINNDVLDIALDDGWLYLVGRFWNVNGQQREKFARVNALTGALDPTWRPFSDGGTAFAVAVDPILDRVYLGGAFSGVDGVAGTQFLTAVSRSSGAVVRAFDPTPAGEVYDILGRPGRVYVALGGPGGTVDVLETARGARAASYTGDGDLQVVAEAGDDVIVGGHHDTGLGGGPFSPIARIRGTDDTIDTDFGPPIAIAEGFGVWALLATDAHLWVGGALSVAGAVPAVGVTRYPIESADPVDTTAPTVPTGVTVDGVSDVTVRLAWAPSVDASATVDYVVYRDGVALGATRSATFVDTTVEPSRHYDYQVAAVDLSGNASASTAAVGATTLGPLTEITAVAFGSTWSYLDTGGAPAADWTDVAYDDSAWPSGNAVLGRGKGNESTVVANRPVTYLRREIVVGADQAVAAATLRFRRDDGVVVYVNGVEVVRNNVPDGPVGHTTNASDFVFGVGESEVFTVDIDPELFGTGPNVVAVSLHNAALSGDLIFDAELRLRVGSAAPDTTPPSAPGQPSVTSLTDGSVGLGWAPATDNVAVVSYEIRRDGVAVGTSTVPSFTDAGLAPSTTYEYTVVARDASGNVGSPSPARSATTTGTPVGDVALVSAGTVWLIDDGGLPPAPDWRTAVVPSGTWKSGVTEIGAGDGGEATVITNRPVVFMRTVFDVGNPAAVTALHLDLLADDGAVVYLNGTEVLRDNVGPGPVDTTTPAASYRWTLADETTLNRFALPAGALQPGANVLAISVHNGLGSSDVSFDARLTASYGAGVDLDPPTAPTGLAQTAATSTSVSLGWAAAFDNVAVAGYRVFRNGVEVATTTQRQVTVTGLAANTTSTYRVEAFDAAGNTGPLSAPLDATTAPASFEPIALNHVWRYLDTGVNPGAGWFAPGFVDTSWATGAAELGAGDGDETTVVTNRPVVWFRTTFAVTSPAEIAAAVLALRADDGAVVYLNGVEVVRDNMPAGPIGPTSAAATYRSSSADETALRDFALPPSLLVAGSNTLAVSVHNGAGSTDLSFAARLRLQGGAAPDVTPPSAPGTVDATAVGSDSVSLGWVPATDDVAVDRYEVQRDGVTVATVFSTTFDDTGLAPATSYTYLVRALDAAGNAGPLSAPLTVTTAPAVVQPVVLVPAGSVWRFLATGVQPAPSWTGVGFADASWGSGIAELGAGDGDEDTVITNRPVVWFRHTFTVPDPQAIGPLVLELMADDGAVVFLNGVELVRDNVAAGALTATTPALTYRNGAAEHAFRPFALPGATLVAGTNVLAISVHNGAGSADLSFDAVLREAG
jgi:chitodextrinase